MIFSQVSYQISGLLDKNRDPLGAGIIGCFQSSSIVLLRKLFPEDLSTPRTLRGGAKTIGLSFQVCHRVFCVWVCSGACVMVCVDAVVRVVHSLSANWRQTCRCNLSR
jgi:hypothetical protein